MSRPEKVQAALKLMCNPYASLSLIDDADENHAIEPSFEQKRAYFKKLENPHAFDAIFGDVDNDLWQAASKGNANGTIARLEKELDEVLDLYKPYVARNDWKRLMEFRPVFLKSVGGTSERVALAISRLKKFKFSLMPGEKVEYNRAPAERIIGELDKILG